MQVFRLHRRGEDEQCSFLSFFGCVCVCACVKGVCLSSDDLRGLSLNQTCVDTVLHSSTLAYFLLTGNKSGLRDSVIFGPVPFQNMSGKIGCVAKQAVTLVLVLAPKSIKK